MAIDVALVRAAGEAAAVVSGFQRATQCRRNAAGSAADVEGITVLVLDDRDHAGLAGEPADGFHGYCRAVLDLAAGRFRFFGIPSAECRRIDVHDDLLPVAAGQCCESVCEEALGQHTEGIGTFLREGDPGCG